jgi:hypothetical protein
MVLQKMELVTPIHAVIVLSFPGETLRYNNLHNNFLYILTIKELILSQ